MRKDQLERLQDLAEQIGDVFMEEADPQNWNGAGQPMATLDQETRGNRYWDKKNAIQTGTLLARVLDLRDRDNRPGLPFGKVPDDDAEKEIKRFEKRAKEMVNAVIARATSKG
jgi:hypothetical protein